MYMLESILTDRMAQAYSLHLRLNHHRHNIKPLRGTLTLRVKKASITSCSVFAHLRHLVLLLEYYAPLAPRVRTPAPSSVIVRILRTSCSVFAHLRHLVLLLEYYAPLAPRVRTPAPSSVTVRILRTSCSTCSHTCAI